MFIVLASCVVYAANDVKAVSKNGISLMLPQYWEVQDNTSDSFKGVLVLFSGDEKLIGLIIERLPGNPIGALAETKAEMAKECPKISEEKLTSFSNLTGEGVRGSGISSVRGRMEYVLFYPKNRLSGLYIIVIFLGTPNHQTDGDIDSMIESVKIENEPPSQNQ